MKQATLVTIGLFFVIVLMVAVETRGEGSLAGLLSVLMVGITVFMVLVSLILQDGSIGTDIAHPESMYGVFYLLYYSCPYLVLFFTGKLAPGMELLIATLLSLGYLSWLIGSRSSPGTRRQFSADRIEIYDAIGLLVLCIAGIGFVGYYYWFRLDDGTFFNQAKAMSQDLTVVDSIRRGLGEQIQLPIILLLALSSSVRHREIAGFSRRVFMLYGALMFVVLVLSSQTRPAITVLVFLFIGTRLYQKQTIKFLHVISVLVLSVIAVLVVHGLRIISAAEFAEAPNQILFAVENAIPNALHTIVGYQSELAHRVVSRGGGGIRFLGEIINAIDERGAFFYGQGVIASLYGLIPRFLWLDKPAVMPPQLVAQELLGFSTTYDASLGPITQFYFEGGWLGVIVGYFTFGCAMAWLTRRTIKSQRISLWIILCVVWGHVANIEQELILGLLTSVRNAALLVCLWWLCRSVCCCMPAFKGTFNVRLSTSQ